VPPHVSQMLGVAQQALASPAQLQEPTTSMLLADGQPNLEMHWLDASAQANAPPQEPSFAS